MQPEVLGEALQRAQAGDWLPHELQARREGLRKAQGHVSQQLERLTTAYLDQVVPLEEYRRRRQEIEQRHESLETQIRQLEAQASYQGNLAAMTASMEAFCARVRTGLDNATFAQKRQLVELLIDRVVVTDVDVEIRYVIPTSPGGEHTRFYQLRLDYFNVVLPGLALVDLVFGHAQASVYLQRLLRLKHAATIAHQPLG
jgi:site-specific DNA recombinase